MGYQEASSDPDGVATDGKRVPEKQAVYAIDLTVEADLAVTDKEVVGEGGLRDAGQLSICRASGSLTTPRVGNVTTGRVGGSVRRVLSDSDSSDNETARRRVMSVARRRIVSSDEDSDGGWGAAMEEGKGTTGGADGSHGGGAQEGSEEGSDIGSEVSEGSSLSGFIVPDDDSENEDGEVGEKDDSSGESDGSDDSDSSDGSQRGRKRTQTRGTGDGNARARDGRCECCPQACGLPP